MPILRERLTESRAATYAKQIGFLTVKVSPAKTDGWPDRVFINRYGLHVYIEIKAEGKRPNRLQIHRINSLRERHLPAFWSSDLAQIERILRAYMDTETLPRGCYPPLDFPSFCGDSLEPWHGEDFNSLSRVQTT